MVVVADTKTGNQDEVETLRTRVAQLERAVTPFAAAWRRRRGSLPPYTGEHGWVPDAMAYQQAADILYEEKG
jgi:hypothetical protein